MALLTHRDPQVIGTALARWIEARDSRDDVSLVDATHPSTGWSSETVLVDLAWSNRVHEFVVRLAPPMTGTFRDYDLTAQFVAQRAAAAAGVPIADPELVTDEQWIGVPFIVMPRVRGHLIGEVAALDPWLTARTDDERARVHEHFVGTLAATHGAEIPGTDVPVRDNAAEITFWAQYLEWSSGGSPLPALVRALEWCRNHQPATEAAPVLLWGDVRLGNVIFGDDLRPTAVLDWDMTSIGAREHDVAWYTMLESTMRALVGRSLPGFPDRDGTVAQYEAASGHTLRDFEWYETLALLRSTAIMTRIGYLHRDAGLRSPLPIEDNPLLELLATRVASERMRE